jgi:hypothetical protein
MTRLKHPEGHAIITDWAHERGELTKRLEDANSGLMRCSKRRTRL